MTCQTNGCNKCVVDSARRKAQRQHKAAARAADAFRRRAEIECRDAQPGLPQLGETEAPGFRADRRQQCEAGVLGTDQRHRLRRIEPPGDEHAAGGQQARVIDGVADHDELDRQARVPRHRARRPAGHRSPCARRSRQGRRRGTSRAAARGARRIGDRGVILQRRRWRDAATGNAGCMRVAASAGRSDHAPRRREERGGAIAQGLHPIGSSMTRPASATQASQHGHGRFAAITAVRADQGDLGTEPGIVVDVHLVGHAEAGDQVVDRRRVVQRVVDLHHAGRFGAQQAQQRRHLPAAAHNEIGKAGRRAIDRHIVVAAGPALRPQHHRAPPAARCAAAATPTCSFDTAAVVVGDQDRRFAVARVLSSRGAPARQIETPPRLG